MNPDTVFLFLHESLPPSLIIYVKGLNSGITDCPYTKGNTFFLAYEGAVTNLPGGWCSPACSSLFSFGQHWAGTFLSQNAHISCFPWWRSSSLLSDSCQGRLGILNWITLTRKKACGILFQHHLASEMPVSTLLPSEPTSPFLLSRGSPACSHPCSSSCKYWLMFLETESSFTRWIMCNRLINQSMI